MNIYDIAREAGVSIATVSRVLNNNPQVNEKTRQRVKEILERHKYSPNAIARGLVANSMKTIGVLTIDIRDIYYASVAYNIEREFTRLGYSVILCNTGGDPFEKIKYIRVLSEKKVDGIILVGSVFSDKSIDRAIADLSANIPVVMVNGYLEAPNIYSIVCDDSLGIKMCIDYLYLKNHRDIVYIQDAETYSAHQKVSGFRAGMEANNLAPSPQSIVKSERGLEGGYHAVDCLISSNVRFTAIVTGEDAIAIGAIKKLKELGIKVPDDVAVTGFNNSMLSLCCEPELTSVDNRMCDMGMSAARILNSILKGEGTEPKTVILPSLVVRKST